MLGSGILTGSAFLALTNCANVDSKGQAPRGVELVSQTRQAITGGPATALTTVWTDNFTSLNATAGCHDGAYACLNNNSAYASAADLTAHDWYMEIFHANGEAQLYATKICNNAATTGGSATRNTDTSAGQNQWNFCILPDAQATDNSALQIRAINVNGVLTSGRLTSKRAHEFKPSAGQGVQMVASIKLAPIQDGDWPSWWLLQRNINDPPVVFDTDTANWPCLGGQEIDILEMGQNSNASQRASWHCRKPGEACVAQNADSNNSVFSNATLAGDNQYHTYIFEWECGATSCSTSAMRFFIDGVQEGGTNGDWNMSGMGYEQFPMFMILNYAVGGNLGKTVNLPAFNNGKVMSVDSVAVNTYNPARRYTPAGDAGAGDAEAGADGGGSPPVARDATQKLAASSNDGQSNVKLEASSDANSGLPAPVQDAGYISAGSFILWDINVPAGNYTANLRSAVNFPNNSASAAILLDGVAVAHVNMPNTGGWQNWATNASTVFNVAAGNHTLEVLFNTAFQNFEWVQFVASGSGAGPLPTCTDGIQDGTETGVDCGGSCPICSGIGLGSTIQAESKGFLSDPGMATAGADHISYWKPGDYVRYPSVVMNGVGHLALNYATQNAGQVMQIRQGMGCNATTGADLGSFLFNNTASWTTYAIADINLPASGAAEDLCLIAPSTNTHNMIDLKTIAFAAGSSPEIGVGASCTDKIQNQGETGVDCGGPCPVACNTNNNPASLSFTTGTATFATTTATGVRMYHCVEGGTSTESSLCWSNVAMTNNTQAMLTYGQQGSGDTIWLTFNGVQIGSTLALVNTGSFLQTTTSTFTFNPQSGTGTLCLVPYHLDGSALQAGEVETLTVQ
jgi:hypothetical protein